VVLRRRGPLPPGRLSPAELAEQAGADPSDVARVEELLSARGLEVLSDAADSVADRLVRAAGPVGVLAEVFGASLERVSSATPAGQVEHRQRTGSLSVPGELDGLVTAVLGLDDRPQSRAHFFVRPAATGGRSYTPLQVGQAYRFPSGMDGSGQTLAIIELGGGYDGADLTTYFGGLGLAVPHVTAVRVDGARNVPGGDPSGADGEVLLDIEVAGALAPGAALVVYFAPNTDAGFLDAVSMAIHAAPTPTALSISWGQQEEAWTAQARQAMDQAFADGSALGVTICVAAGDDGSSDRASDGRPHVDFPASSPHVLGCGGTFLTLDAVGATHTETVWNDPGRGATGGGVSTAFPQPAWQAGAGVPGSGRGVPDIAGDADPASGYEVLVDGTASVIGGTSAVAPLWAALVCRLAQALGRPLGLLAPVLYASGRPGLRDITHGNNGAFKARRGWDACTGLGTPDGEVLLAVLRAEAPAGG